ncbi:hypothetical protein H9639_00295 [Arthrobacter sp. Sa2CUA1]|uniref:DUF308 domain-containing protein n=1 Tax=Arthrobacter gallicola TaxID=2762225 RepID=A0ABR8UMH3_9MICC|nr:hypothetical protein [Arthrobacter gallicola]MBD7993744.1 hypothetical protein [Arthrobacter gallicola]
MTEREPDRNESTDDATWQDLVARLQETPDLDPGEGTPGRSADAGPGAAVPPGSRTPPDPRSAAERTRAIFENQPLRRDADTGSIGPGPRDYSPQDDESDGSFVPEEPPPLGSGEPLVILAWLGAAGGPLLLLLFAMFWRSAPLTVVLGIVALFVASSGYLLYRLPQHRDEDDDGAAV